MQITRMQKELLNMCIEIYELDPAHSLTAPGLAWQASLKRTKVNLDPLADIVMLSVEEKGIREGVCHSIINVPKLMTDT